MSATKPKTDKASQNSPDERLRALVPVIRLSIADPDHLHGSEFGRGVAKLCRGVKEKGSLNAAAKDMGMAYSKAWRIVRDTEAALGIKLLNREGAHGSTLTDECERLLRAFGDIEEKLQASATQEYLASL